MKKISKILTAGMLAFVMAALPACGNQTTTKYDGNYKAASPEELTAATENINENTVFGDMTAADWARALKLDLNVSLNADLSYMGVDAKTNIDFKTNGKIVLTLKEKEEEADPTGASDDAAAEGETEEGETEEDKTDVKITALTALSLGLNYDIKGNGASLSSSASRNDNIAWIDDFLYVSSVTKENGKAEEPELTKINPLNGLFWGLGEMGDMVKEAPIGSMLEGMSSLEGLDFNLDSLFGGSGEADVSGIATSASEYGFDLGLDASNGVKIRVKANKNFEAKLAESIKNSAKEDEEDATTAPVVTESQPEMSVKVNDITAYAIFDAEGALNGIKFNVSLDFVIENIGKIRVRANGSLEPTADASLDLPTEEELADYVESDFSIFKRQ